MKFQIPTPALMVDLDKLEANIATLQAAVSARGKKLRPHGKAHKRVPIAQRQMEAGACGVCAATLGELEMFTAAGINVLLTTPAASPVKAERIAAARNVSVVVDSPVQVSLYAEAARKHGIVLDTLVDLDVGDHRTGVPCDERAVELAKLVDANGALRFGGLQAYSVSGSHTVGLLERGQHSRNALAQAVAVQRELLRVGLDATRLTGGSTGTWNIDIEIPEFTELQAGSYPLMDVAYRRIGDVPFAVSMTVLATVISASHRDRVTVDAGFKAFSTDRPFGPEAIGIPEAEWQWAGDEHGIVFGEFLPEIGRQVEFITPHTDPTVNLHQYMYAHRNGEIVEVWPR
ncbi:MAG: DSD1 family PLP-dependent enzyme [Acidobacteria bacterium]|nr:DSD1 family PLP-dependent enzyme [Acidobacteriota bacterium]